MQLMANNHTTSPMPLHEKCQYPSKPCPQRRAVKDDGKLHRLCEFHRQLANRNQQRLQQRRRLLRQDKRRPLGVNALQETITNSSHADSRGMDGLSELALEDLEILLQLLDNSDDGLFDM